MPGETAAPCRHSGAPPDEIIDLVATAVKSLASDVVFLKGRGLTPQDFELALPAAIQRIRGSAAASNSDRRVFLADVFRHMANVGAITRFEVPQYGDDTVYRLYVKGLGSVAIIQKGCPDGRHSSVAWSAPDWAEESYLWWLCDSLQYEPGEHVAKGVNRLRNRFFSKEHIDAIDGVIFHNATCGTALRPCPKMGRAVPINERMVPPPCVWVMPAKTGGNDWNWDGSRTRKFPRILLSVFGVKEEEVPLYTGHVGFLKGARGTRTTISSRYGTGSTTTYRSDSR
jgi:hypothetical protein